MFAVEKTKLKSKIDHNKTESTSGRCERKKGSEENQLFGDFQLKMSSSNSLSVSLEGIEIYKIK